MSELEAGRELDALIEERIFGNPVDREFDEPIVKARRDKYDQWGVLPPYSTDMGAAWEVVEHMIRRVDAAAYRIGSDHLRWDGPLYKPKDMYLTQEGYPLGSVCWYVLVEQSGRRRWTCAKTPALAICRAALAVMEAPA